MVTHGFAIQAIKNYLSQWCSWWVKTNAQWSYQQLLIEFIQTTHQAGLGILAKDLFNAQFGLNKKQLFELIIHPLLKRLSKPNKCVCFFST